MRVVVINAGSSSIKYKVFAVADESTLVEGLLERIGSPEAKLKHRRRLASGAFDEVVEARPVADHKAGLELILEVARQRPAEGDSGPQPAGGAAGDREVLAFGHRVVHGGERFSAPVRVDDEVIKQIRELIPLAPLHNPPNLAAIEVLRGLRPDVPNVAVFDTAFHQTMPPRAFRYALPDELYRTHHVRRYGFHGSSHGYVAAEACRHLGVPAERLNLITLHLGNGASAAAIAGGKCIDTSMGLTPLEGLMMGTRSGDIDPAIPSYLARATGMTLADIDNLLNKESGLLGIAGVNDLREVQRRADAGDAQAVLALEMFGYRIRKYIGAYAAVLGRIDAIVFTGGIGENSAPVRAESCRGLAPFGIVLDESRNRAAGSGVREVQPANERVKVLVIPTDEEREIARQTIAVIGRPARA